MNVLLTGGLGYIGSHTCIRILHDKHEVVLLDNLSNSSVEVLDSIEKISGVRPPFFNVDLRDDQALNQVFGSVTPPDVVIHFAGLKAAAESVKRPLDYYENNVIGTFNLISNMRKVDCSRIVFSSSATVYGPPKHLPVTEAHPLCAINPYAQTKIDVEQMLLNVCKADAEFSAIALRYFNPIGAHKTALLGDNPPGTPNNLMPFVTKVAKGELPELKIFGADYDTPDGTGIRDYIHVEDLATAHSRALNWTDKHRGFEAVNIGTGIGHSVLQIIDRFQDVTKVPINYTIEDKRDGDVAECYAACDKAVELLGFRAKHNLESMLSSAWARASARG